MFERYAIFYTPEGALAAFGAAWLGWDSATGRAVAHPKFDGIDVAAITKVPRKYGLHATLKAPFRLASGYQAKDLHDAVARFAAAHAPVEIGALTLNQDNGFVGLRAMHQTAQLADFAAQTVKYFDFLRAPLTEAYIARRRKSRLTPRQDQNMLDWGYPHIFDDFQFHITLSRALPQTEAERVVAALLPHISPLLDRPYTIEALTVMGQDADGLFHQIERYALRGAARDKASRL